MAIAQFNTRLPKPPRQVSGETATTEARTHFSAILQGDLLTLRLSRLDITIPITFDAGHFVQQMAWLLDVEEDAA